MNLNCIRLRKLKITGLVMLIPAAMALAQITYVPVSLTQAALLTVDIGADTGLFAGYPFQLNANVQGGTAAYTYQWSPGMFMSDSTIANPICVIPQLGQFTITCMVTDANGCTVVDDKLVTTAVNSINEFANSGVELYPNPATNVIYLRRVNNQNRMKIVIMDLSGRTILEEQWMAETILELNISHLANGIYMLQLESGNQKFQQKVNIQK